jgi:hypothetical protein
MCVLIFKSFHRPHGKIADVLAPDSRLHNFERSGQLQNVRAAETLKVPIAPMGKLLTCLPSTHACITAAGQLQNVRAAKT